MNYFMSYFLQQKVLTALENAGVFTSGGLVKDKVLFCSSETGRSSFVRQLEPDWHIDTNPEIIFQLARFIKYQLHISPIRPERAAANLRVYRQSPPVAGLLMKGRVVVPCEVNISWDLESFLTSKLGKWKEFS
ncbi:hypothetical protein OIU85_007207 [Salix viminalis]|uniref:Uncharacterized protein n=1 Tax=Salix viminalis TaxID=40686 RepID=A0A9Q0SNN8_SALVM|nr:hypothetical protein OIU85_007207 [Salix viminalis]